MSKQTHSDVLIIGAGMAGLMAANSLQNKGVQVILLDKGRRVGGRLATRRVGPGRVDHGAQFFTVRTIEFQNWINDWMAEGLVYQWSTGWSDGSITTEISDGHPRYAVRGGMNALARQLAKGLTTRVDVRATRVAPTGEGWQVEEGGGRIYTCQALLLTPPVPQSLALLDAGQVELAADNRATLEQITYAPCLAGLFLIQGAINLPEPGTIQRLDAPISWIADNKRKGISPEATTVTVHASPRYSHQHWQAPEVEVITFLKKALEVFLPSTSQITEAYLKRWRYALPTNLHNAHYLLGRGLPPLVFAGDAFKGPRVEGAALSGLAAAAVIYRQLTE